MTEKEAKDKMLTILEALPWTTQEDRDAVYNLFENNEEDKPKAMEGG